MTGKNITTQHITEGPSLVLKHKALKTANYARTQCRKLAKVS